MRYVSHSPPDRYVVCLAAKNRTIQRMKVQSGLVETDWYSSPVNMILRKPSNPIHFSEGEEVAQVILVSRAQRNPNIEILQSHSRLSRETRKSLTEWYAQHAK